MLEKNIPVVSLLDKTVSTFIAPLELLYKYFSYTKNQFGKQLADPNGMYLVQSLHYKVDDAKGKDIKNALSNWIGDAEIRKNYHITFIQHKMEMFKNNDPIFINHYFG